MIKYLLISVLCLMTSLSFGQNKFTTSHYGSVLMECFYTLKISSSFPIAEESKEAVISTISDMCGYLQTQLDNHKILFDTKLGEADLKALANQIKGYQQFISMMGSPMTNDQKMSTQLWIALSKPQVEKLFIKLNR